MSVGGYYLIAVLLAALPADRSGGGAGVADQQVDLIELNHFVDKEGRQVFRQLLFYDWSRQHRRFIVRAWRLVKDDSLLPRRRWNPSGYECVWHDDGVLRRVTAPSYRETWTQHDPERANRKIVPEEARVPLLRPKKQR